MTHAEQASLPWLDQALLDPGSVFARPEEVVDHPGPPEQKPESGHRKGIDAVYERG